VTATVLINTGAHDGAADALLDAKAVGDGTTDDSAAFAAWVTSLAGAERTLHVWKVHELSSALTFPSNVHLRVLRGGGFTSTNGSVLTHRGTVEAGRYQIWRGSLAVRFSTSTDTGLETSALMRVAYPEWWGAYPYQKGSPVDVTAQVNAMVASQMGYPAVATGTPRWCDFAVEWGQGVYRITTSGPNGSAVSAAGCWGFNWSGAGAEQTMIEIADGPGVAFATPATAALDLNGCFYPRLIGFSVGAVSGQGNFRYTIYYHRETTTSALGSSQLHAEDVEVLAPWITSGWQLGSAVGSTSFTNQEDNTLLVKCSAKRNAGYAADGYCVNGFAWGTGTAGNNLNHRALGIETIGCGFGLLVNNTNVVVADYDCSSNDVDLWLNTTTNGSCELNGVRSEGARKFIHSTSGQTVRSKVTIRNFLVHLNALANDPTDGTPDWGRLALPGSWLFQHGKITAITNQSLVPTVRLASASGYYSITFDDVEVQNAPLASTFIFDAAAAAAWARIRIEGYAQLDVNDNVVEAWGYGAPLYIRKSGARNVQHATSWSLAGATPDARFGAYDIGQLGASYFVAHQFAARALGNPEAPLLSAFGGGIGTTWTYAVVGKVQTGSGTFVTSLPGATATVANNASLDATHYNLINLYAWLGHSKTPLATHYDVLRNDSGTWHSIYLSVAAEQLNFPGVKDTGITGSAYALPTADGTGTATFDGLATFNGPTAGLDESDISPIAFTADGNTGTAITLTWTLAKQKRAITATGNFTATIAGIPAGGSMVVQVNTGAGSFTGAFAAGIGMGALRWMGGAAPTLTATASKIDEYMFAFNGTDTIAYVIGQAA